MALSNYTDLVNSVASLLGNRTDLFNDIPDWIALTEGDIRVDMRSRGVTFDDLLVIDGPEVQLATNIKVVRSLFDDEGPIKLVSPEEIARLRKRYPSGGRRPQWASIIGADADTIDVLLLMVAPVPQEEVQATIVYEPDLPALTGSSPTNWLMSKHPNIYLYGAAKHGSLWLRDDERVPIFDKLYHDSMDKLQQLRDDVEFGAGPLVAMPRRSL